MRKLTLLIQDKDGTIDYDGYELTDPYIVSEIAGLGINYSTQKNRDFEYAFEPITLTINIRSKDGQSAYQNYSRLVDFMSNRSSSKLILQYEFDGKTRYCDVMLKSVTKSQLTTYNVLTEIVTLDRLSPYYEIVSVESPGKNEVFNLAITNAMDYPIPLKITFYNAGDISDRLIRLIDASTGAEVSKIECELKAGHRLTLDGESKQATYLNLSSQVRTNAYDAINHTYDSFMIVPPLSVVTLNDQLGTPLFIYHKKWVVD